MPTSRRLCALLRLSTLLFIFVHFIPSSNHLEEWLKPIWCLTPKKMTMWTAAAHILIHSLHSPLEPFVCLYQVRISIPSFYGKSSNLIKSQEDPPAWKFSKVYFCWRTAAKSSTLRWNSKSNLKKLTRATIRGWEREKNDFGYIKFCTTKENTVFIKDIYYNFQSKLGLS